MAQQRAKAPDEKFCSSCGEAIKVLAEICPHCGVRQLEVPYGGPSDKTDATLPKTDATLPMILNGILGFIGFMGIGHMTAGSVGTGLVLLFVGWGISIVGVVIGAFTAGIGFFPFFFLYIAIWLWSIFNVRSVVAQKR